jgi:hypothetical protein
MIDPEQNDGRCFPNLTRYKFLQECNSGSVLSVCDIEVLIFTTRAGPRPNRPSLIKVL